MLKLFEEKTNSKSVQCLKQTLVIIKLKSEDNILHKYMYKYKTKK